MTVDKKTLFNFHWISVTNTETELEMKDQGDSRQPVQLDIITSTERYYRAMAGK